MFYKLPEPFRGATHLLIEESFTDFETQVRITGLLGAMEKDVFVPDPALIAVGRTIAGDEYVRGFHPFVRGLGAPDGNFRDCDIVEWFNKYGWLVSTWKGE